MRTSPAYVAPDLEVAGIAGFWVVQMRGAMDAVSWHRSRDQAIEVGRALARARGVDLRIEDGRGRIDRVETYREAARGTTDRRTAGRG